MLDWLSKKRTNILYFDFDNPEKSVIQKLLAGKIVGFVIHDFFHRKKFLKLIVFTIMILNVLGLKTNMT